MAHRSLLTGKIILSDEEKAMKIAKKLVRKGLSRKFLKLEFYKNYHRKKSISTELYDGAKRINIRDRDHYGWYVIYKNNKNICLYSGFTNYNIRSRLYRFGKELLGESRNDEDHSAASKFRESRDNDGSNVFRVKFIPLDEVLFSNCDYDDEVLGIVDECVAGLLKSKYNSKIIRP